MIDKSLFIIKGIKSTLVLLTITATLQGLALIVQATNLANIITDLFNGEKLINQLSPLLYFVTAFLGRQILVWVRDKKMDAFSSQAGSAVRKQLLDKLFALGPRFTQTQGTGNLVTLSLEGVSQLELYIKLFLPKLFNMAIIPAIVLTYTFTLDKTSALTMLIVLPILIFFMAILGLAAQRKADQQYESYRLLSNHFVDSLRGLETLRLLGLSQNYDRNIGTISERYRKATMGTLKFAFLSTFALDFFTSLSVAVVALFLGLALIEGNMVLGPALTVLILAPEYFLPIREFGTDYHATLDGKESWSAIQKILDWPLSQRGDSYPLRDWKKEDRLEINGLTVRHQNEHQASLNNLYFSWQGPGKIGIIGASGAGKSTLIDVLGGFLEPTEGEFSINGKTSDHFHLNGWMNQLLYIPQHPYIFNDTVANNVMFYTPQATEIELKQACEQAGLTRLIEDLPNGMNEQIGESGRILSGGQEQRIALARAFLDKQRKILLFDEPTAHLDIETEYDLKEKMLPLFDERLVFFASHRLHWMREMDQIIVLDHGEIVEVGTHEELLANKGQYCQLISAQTSRVEVQHG